VNTGISAIQHPTASGPEPIIDMRLRLSAEPRNQTRDLASHAEATHVLASRARQFPPGRQAPPGLRFQATRRTSTPITAKTPTESSLDRLHSGPEQGSTFVSVAHAKMLAFRMDATPPTQSGRRERPTVPSNQSADETMTVPPRKKSAPKTIKGADSAAHLGRTMKPTMTGKTPYSNGTPRQTRPIRFGIVSTVRHCTAKLSLPQSLDFTHDSLRRGSMIDSGVLENPANEIPLLGL
jgi:hypothetical protein